MNQKTFLTKEQQQIIYYEAFPTSPVKGVIQLIHGSLEHFNRYQKLIKHFVQSGYIVIGNDHRGHGKTAKGNLGHPGQDVSGGLMVDDLLQLNQIIKQNYPHLPLTILGHSWGSYLTRVLISKPGVHVTNVVLSGTGWETKFSLNSVLTLINIVKTFKGPNNLYSPRLYLLMFSQLNKKFKTEHKHAWLSNISAEQAKFDLDPYNGKMFSLSGLKVLLQTVKLACDSTTIKATAPTLPILIVSGDQDAAGKFTKAVKRYAQILAKNNFSQVTVNFYPNQRHEVHHDLMQDLFATDITQWIDQHRK